MWHDDGSGAVKSHGEADEFVVEGKAAGDSPVNARFSSALATGQYFEIEVRELKQGCFVGIATEDGFAKGYKIRGLFFGGNLSEGSSLVRQNFGDRPTKGMILGALVEYDDEAVTITFYQDGRCLGPAFVAKRLTSAEIFPVVKASSDGDRFAIRFPDTLPTGRVREPKAGSASAHFAEGNWFLKRMSVGPELGEFPLAAKMQGREVRLKVEAVGPQSFRLFSKVANTLRAQATSKEDDALKPFEGLTVGPVMSTMMMGEESVMEVEKALKDSLEQLHKWLVADGQLLMVGPAAELSLAPAGDDGGDAGGLPATEVDLP